MARCRTSGKRGSSLKLSEGRRPSRRQQALLERQALKGVTGIVTKVISVPSECLTGLPTQAMVDALDGNEYPIAIGAREIFSAAISSHLVAIVDELLAIGFVGKQTPKQRPYPFDKEAWDCLMKASDVTGLSIAALLEIVVVRLQKHGLASVKLTDAMQQLDLRLGTSAATGR